MSEASPQMPRLAFEILAVVVVIGILGWVNLPIPLHGDAALYQLGAKALADGEMLYRDFWDLKQPGIYLFHWLAGSLFGFTETGLHAFELIYLLGFSILQLVVLRRYLSFQWLAPAVPLVTVGSYLALSNEWHLTQPAILLSAPLFCVLALLTAPAARWRSVLAGAAGSVAVLFKFAVAPVVGILFVASWAIDRRARGASVQALWRDRLLPALVGAVLVTGGMTLWLYRHDALQQFVWVFQTWAPLALEVRGAHPIGRVLESTMWFIFSFAPQLLLAAFARLGWRDLASERLFVLALVWLAAGALSILTEPFAGWQFDFLMLATPLGVLAIRGLDGLLGVLRPALAPRQVASAAALLLALAALPAGGIWARKARSLASNAKLTSEPDYAFQRAVSQRYEDIWQSTDFLRQSGSMPGPIYVFGDPLVHTLSRRTSASSIHGWAWELQPAVIWRRLESELIQQPPAFIFAEPGYDAMLTVHSPTLRAMLDRDYSIRTKDGTGVWYARREAPGT